jgi:hypothetical protein
MEDTPAPDWDVLDWAVAASSLALERRLRAGTIPAHGRPITRKNEKSVKFVIEIGDAEKHRLEYNFNQLLGSLLIKVNEKPIKKARRLINEPILEVHAFAVGEQEKSDIRIEKERKPLIGSKHRLYVNNRLVKVFSGA